MWIEGGHPVLTFFGSNWFFNRFVSCFIIYRNGFHIECNKAGWNSFSHNRLLCLCGNVDIFSNIWRILWLYQVSHHHIYAMITVITNYILFRNLYRKTATNDTENQGAPANGATKKPVQFGSKSMNEYLLGSRKLKPFPVAMSLVARFGPIYSYILIMSQLSQFKPFSCAFQFSVIFRVWQYWERRPKSTISAHNIGWLLYQFYWWDSPLV